jgi:hypothetical protein
VQEQSVVCPCPLYLDIDYGLTNGDPIIRGTGVFIVANDGGAFYQELMDRAGMPKIRFSLRCDTPPNSCENPEQLNTTNQWAIYGSEFVWEADFPLRVVGLQKSAGMDIRWSSFSGATYQVEWAGILKTTEWQRATTVTALSHTTTWTDLGSTNRPSPAVATNRFYRVKSQ